MSVAVFNGVDFALTIVGILAVATIWFLYLAYLAHKYEAQEKAERRELDSPFSELRAESAEKVTRAQFRHTTRHTRRG